MGSGGTEWEVADVISNTRMNQKTLFVGTGAQVAALSTTYAGMYVYITTGGSGFVADTLYQRNAADSAWVAWSIVGKQDIPISAVAIWERTTTGSAALARSESSTNKLNYWTLDFDQTTAEYAQFNMPSIRNWNAGTVDFIPYWTASGGSGTVKWDLQGVSLADSDAIDTAFGTAVGSTDTLLTADDIHIGPQSAAITIAGSPVAGEWEQFQISRDTATDTLSADAKLMGIIMELSLAAGIAA